MPRPRRWSDLGADDGSASIEFITVGLLLTLPLVYLILTLSSIQAAVLATEGAARHSARSVTLADSHAAGLGAADAAIAVALADVGLEASAVSVVCSPNPSNCVTPGGVVTVVVATSVPLPLAPPVLGLDVGLAIPIEAASSMPVSVFVGTDP